VQKYNTNKAELSHSEIEMGQFVQYLLREYTYASITRIRRSLRVITNVRNYGLL
jgi:hypothetical protein